MMTNPSNRIRKTPFIILLLTSFFMTYGCIKKETSAAYLSIDNIQFKETYSSVVLDLPDGSYSPDNPDFDINNPNTWTGNMAQYVKRNYFYSITCTITNTGGSVAYDAETDIYYTYDIGEEDVETVSLGNFSPGATANRTTNIHTVNKELIECSAEVFWYY